MEGEKFDREKGHFFMEDLFTDVMFRLYCERHDYYMDMADLSAQKASVNKMLNS